jgi:hypothetical protein
MSTRQFLVGYQAHFSIKDGRQDLQMAHSDSATVKSKILYRTIPWKGNNKQGKFRNRDNIFADG